MEDQRELVFHDTVPLPDNQLEKAYIDAKYQKQIILEFFRLNPDRNFTPYEVWHELWTMMLLNSVRRSITDLTKEGRLWKCQWSDSRMGEFGKLNRTWRYNTDYLPNINRK